MHKNCHFDLWSPERRSSIANKAFSSYAFRQQQIEDVINLLVEAPDPNDYSTQIDAYAAVNLNSDTLTDNEVEYMIKEIRRRRA